MDESCITGNGPETKTAPEIALLQLWIAPYRASRKSDRITIRTDEKIIKVLTQKQGFIVKLVSKF
ncbi:allophanate hydrolase subunit 2 [Polaromonas sp. CG_9.5]|uniref:hypothetical protein n=1 Tax=Polaromonas sp. CG_9.5 TaxID=3071705 RepID=UPI002E0AB051|nr:allophanate hydrolase subunit 2 [Polaromonas sp. CG_9.5]